MLTLPGHHLGDSWYFADGDVIHCFFLMCPDDIPRHAAWDIGHATSSDLTRWTYHGIVLRRGDAEAWDGLCLATGTILRRGGSYWMAYTGNWCGPEPAVGLAHSPDLHTWEKLPGNPVTRIDERHYTSASRGSRPFPHWRDPFLLEMGDFVYQLVCATAARGEGRAGTIGVARTGDMSSWEILPPLDVESLTEEMECPQVVAAQGRFYLMYSTLDALLLSNTGEVPGGNMYSLVGDTPLGPFRIGSAEPVLPADMPERPYAARIVWLRRNPYLLGTVWRDSGDRICDPIPVEFTDTGIAARL